MTVGCPGTLTDQCVPDVRPVSVNVIEWAVENAKVVTVPIGPPLIENEPVAGFVA